MADPSRAQEILGLAVRQLRKERDWSQEDLSEATGLHPTWISRLETGRLNTKWSNVVLVCDALGVSLERLGAVVDQVRGSTRR